MRSGVMALSLLTVAGFWWSPTAWTHSEEATVSVKVYTPIVIDGKVDDWAKRIERSNWAAQLEVKKGKVLELMRAVPAHVNALTANIETGTISRPEDLSAVVYTMWDDHAFYIAAVVTDDEVVSQHEDKDIWQDDCLELWFDCRHDAVTHALFQDDEYQLGFSPASRYRNRALAWAWRNPRPEPVIKAMQVASSLTTNGYLIEAAVPWVVLQGCQPAIGGMIGFNISVVDKDEDELWTHLTWSGQLHSDPAQFGHLYFVDAPVDLLPSDVFEHPPELLPWETETGSTP